MQVMRDTKCGKHKMSGGRLFEALDLYNIKRGDKMNASIATSDCIKETIRW